jgi:NADH-quinone oxidoreductase subunit C
MSVAIEAIAGRLAAVLGVPWPPPVAAVETPGAVTASAGASSVPNVPTAAPTPAPAVGASGACGASGTVPAAGGAAVPAVPAAAVVGPVQLVEHKARGVHLDVVVTADRLVAVAEQLDRDGFAIDTVTGVDWMAADQMEVVYDFFHPTAPWRVAVRTRVPRAAAAVPTISEVFPGANWHERETHDFFGIRFTGHPDLSPFLLPEDADYHPLRKDFRL